MEKDNIYWLCVLVGLLIVIALYFGTRRGGRFENFANPLASATSAVNSATNAVTAGTALISATTSLTNAANAAKTAGAAAVAAPVAANPAAAAAAGTGAGTLASGATSAVGSGTTAAGTLAGTGAAAGTGAGTLASAAGTGAGTLASAAGTGAGTLASAAGTGAASAGTGSGSGAAGAAAAAASSPSVALPALMDLPYLNSLIIYVNAFNIDNGTNKTFGNNPGSTCAVANTWCDAKAPDSKIQLISTNLVTITNKGLPIKNITLQGPSSKDLLGPTNNTDILGDFSVLFYGRFNSLLITSTQPVILYEAFAETPNSIRLSITPYDSDNVYVELLLGNSAKKYQWLISNTTLMSNGNTTLYSLVFVNDPVKPTATFYIGSNDNVANVDINNTGIRMGYSHMRVNTNGQLDMNILAFAYYNKALTFNDLSNIGEFFMQQAGGFAALQQQIDSSNAKAIQLQSTIDQNALTLQGLQSKLTQCSASLDQCNASIPAKDLLPDPRSMSWQIKDPDGKIPVSATDAKKCGLLAVNKAGPAGSAATSSPHTFPTVNRKLPGNITPSNAGIGNIIDPTQPGGGGSGSAASLIPASAMASIPPTIAGQPTGDVLTQLFSKFLLSAPAGSGSATLNVGGGSGAGGSAQSQDIQNLQAQITAMQQQQSSSNQASFQNTYNKLAKEATMNPLPPATQSTATTTGGSGTTAAQPFPDLSPPSSSATPSATSDFWTALGF